MMTGFRLFLRRCVRITVAPGREVDQIVSDRTRLGGWLLGWLVTALSMLWVGEALWPVWNSVAGYLGVALLAAAPWILIQGGMLHLAGRLMGGRGRWDITVALCGYGTVPFLALALILGGGIAVYVRVFGPIPFHLASILLLVLALLVTMITGLVIVRHGLSSNYGLSARRAWLVTAVGALVFTLGNNALRGGYVTRCAITVANLAAMPQIPVPLVAAGSGEARRLSLEYAANLRYYRETAIRRGDILIFRGQDGHGWMGRVLGLPGEQAGLQNGHLVVDGALQLEPWQTSGDLTIPPRQIGPDEYFLWTDERTPDLELATESRFPAIAKRDQILGPVLRLDVVLLSWVFGQPRA